MPGFAKILSLLLMPQQVFVDGSFLYFSMANCLFTLSCVYKRSIAGCILAGRTKNVQVKPLRGNLLAHV
jgi:hypothetical protein